MPETPIDEDAGAESHYRQVGSARQCLGVDAITEAVTEQETTHEHLRSRILRPYSAHAVAPLFWCHLICHFLTLTITLTLTLTLNPQLLEEFVILTHHLIIQFAILKVEGQCLPIL